MTTTTATLDNPHTGPSRSAGPGRHVEPTTGGGSLFTHARVLARRSLIKMWRTPEALIDVTLQPVVFLALFTYIFGGAIAGGSQQEYLQFLLPGMVGQLIAMASVSIGVNLNQDIEKGVFDRFRSLPISRSARWASVCSWASRSAPAGSECSRRSGSRWPSRSASPGSRCSSG